MPSELAGTAGMIGREHETSSLGQARRATSLIGTARIKSHIGSETLIVVDCGVPITTCPRHPHTGSDAGSRSFPASPMPLSTLSPPAPVPPLPLLPPLDEPPLPAEVAPLT